MNAAPVDRRQFLSLATLAALALPVAGAATATGPAAPVRRRILGVGAHPDDPESGCGGTLARLAQAGHDVACCYLTTGEAGIPGRSHAEAAAIRRAEAEAACRVLGTRAVFAGQVDGATVVDGPATQAFATLLAREAPEVVLTHWPLDSHRDHQAAATLVLRAWVESEAAFELYFYEVMTGIQSMGFHPTDWVDITAVQALKRRAVDCHASQDPAGIYSGGHTTMEDMRGRELGVTAAEAFVHLTGRGRTRPL